MPSFLPIVPRRSSGLLLWPILIAMIEKLEEIKHRFEEVGQLIVQPDIVTDMEKYGKLNKEYKDLEKIFRNHPDEAIWFNRYNTAENKNYGDAFLLRLFHGTIDKVENPDNESIYDTYAANGRPYKESVWAREWEEMKLMEREHNLWEY